MAAPVINSVTVTYPQGRTYKHPGEAATIVVDASDPDSLTYDVTITVRDASNATTDHVAGVLQSDPLTYSATTVTGHSVTQDLAQPNRFTTV
jgi:hypothetical protein